MSVSSKSCIVTGAANGVGLAIARRLAEEGARVVLADIDEENLSKEVKALQDDGLEAQAFCGDLRRKLNIANLLSATIDAYDRVDILINASRKVELCEPMDLFDCFKQDTSGSVGIFGGFSGSGSDDPVSGGGLCPIRDPGECDCDREREKRDFA